MPDAPSNQRSRVSVGRVDAPCYRWRVAANIYEAVKHAMQDLIAPQLESIKGEIGALRAEMRGTHEALRAEIRRIDDKLTWALDLRERIVALETKVGN